jgi:iron complex outermembrane receptor protein
MNFNRNLLSEAVRFGIAAGAVGLLGLTAPAYAQDDSDEAAELERIEVTGSRIKRADVEGALPVTVIDREDLELSGDVSVADYLRNTTFNSFGSFRPQSGSSAQSNATVSLRGVGSSRTLILVDGRRAPVSPSSGNSQDLNSIPLAAVERIEILSDGASAIYGSDAIGGVVNIITRKDFNGVELMVGMGDPKQAGGETEEGSAIFGISGDRGNMLAGISYSNRGIIFQRERDYSAGGVSTFSNNFMVATPSPGSLYGFVPGGFLANPTNGSVPPGANACNGPGFTTSGSGTSRRCFYDFTFVAADEAEIRNESLFTRGSYQINDDWSTYMNANVSRVKSFGRYAPVPSSPWPGGQPFIPVGSPNHPAVRFPTAGYNPNVPVFLRHRFAALGNRDTLIDSQVYNLLLGAEGQIGDFFLDFGVRTSEFKYVEFGRNYVVGGLAQQFIASGAYDIYAPFQNGRDILDGMIATINRDSLFKVEELYGTASIDLWEMGGGSAGLAFGTEFRSEDYADIYDTLQSSGQIVGSAGNSAQGGRNVKAAFGELLLPVLSNLEVSLAARYDEYSDYGNDTSPKLAVRWQPLESLTIRGSIGQGFRAPTLDILTAQPAFGASAITDPQTCLAFGQPATCTTQVTTYTISNPNLSSEHSDQWTVGLAWDATDWLNMTVDYYDIEIEDRIAFIDIGTVQRCLLGAIPCPPGVSTLPINISPGTPSGVAFGLGLARSPTDGQILFGQIGFSNRGTLETDGVDFNFRTNFEFGEWGSLQNGLQISYVNSYSFDGGRNLVDDPSVPEFRAVLTNQWTYGDFTFAWNINHIDSTLSTAGTLAAVGANDYGYAHRLPSWTTHDLQASWNAPWNGRVTVGVTNAGNKAPVLDPFAPTGRPFDYNLYDGYGRVPYVRYTQNF